MLLDISIRDILFVHDEVGVGDDVRGGDVGVGYCDSLRNRIGRCWSPEDQRNGSGGEGEAREMHCENVCAAL